MILLYGATGYTGKLTAFELARRKLEFAIAGRNVSKLLSLSKTLRDRFHTDVQIFALKPHEFEDFKPPEGFRMILNTAGPFARFGLPVVKCAVENSLFYADSSGEAVWAMEVRERFDDVARGKGIVVSVGCAWETVAGEVAVTELLKKLKSKKVSPSRIVLIYLADFHMSAGTLRTSLDILRAGAFVWSQGEFRKVEPAERRIDFKLDSKSFSAVNISTADVVNVSMIVSRYFPSAEFEVMFSTSRGKVEILIFLLKVFRRALRLPFLHALLDYVARYHVPPDRRKAEQSRASAIAIAFDGDREIERFVLSARDPYYLTAKFLAKSAEVVRKNKVKGSGYVPPSVAFRFTLRDF